MAHLLSKKNVSGLGKTLEHELEVVQGLKVDRGYISPYFINNKKTQEVELENPLVMVYEKKISSVQAPRPLRNTQVGW